MKTISKNFASICLFALATMAAHSALASNAGKFCKTVDLANGGSVTVCRELLSSTYSLGGRALNVSYTLNGKADCATSEASLPATAVWVKAGSGEAVLATDKIDDVRYVPVKFEINGNYDQARTCSIRLSATFTDYQAQNEPDARLRAIHQAMMSNTDTDVEFAVSNNGHWDSKFGANYRVSVMQYR